MHTLQPNVHFCTVTWLDNCTAESGDRWISKDGRALVHGLFWKVRIRFVNWIKLLSLSASPTFSAPVSPSLSLFPQTLSPFSSSLPSRLPELWTECIQKASLPHLPFSPSISAPHSCPLFLSRGSTFTKWNAAEGSTPLTKQMNP